jgi:glycine betaine/proline transport system substrate-binding protein
MKFKLSAFAATAVLGAAGAAQADCGNVSISEMDWASSAVVTHVADFIMTNGYGCTVQRVPTTTVPAMTSLAETGEPDIVTELWTIYTPDYFELRDQGKVVELSKVLSDGGVEAWWIPDYLAEKHPELTTLEGVLANPELVAGRFHDCPAGWGCDVTNLSNLTAAGAEAAGIERFQHGSGETLATSIAAAFEAKEPWFGYYWAPTSVLGRYPMVQVETAGYDEAVHTCNSDPDCAEAGLSAYPPADVVTTASAAFVEREPDVAEFLRKMSYTNDQMNAVLAWQDDNGASYEEAAVHFLTTYQDVWTAWLNEDARNNLSALLK